MPKEFLPVAAEYDLKLYQREDRPSHVWLVDKTFLPDLQKIAKVAEGRG